MQKAPNPKHSGKPGHNVKTKPKDKVENLEMSTVGRGIWQEN